MNVLTAEAILNDPAYVAAYAFYFRKPMATQDETYRMALDWLNACSVVSANSARGGK